MSARPARPTHLIGQRVTVKQAWHAKGTPAPVAETVTVTRVVWDRWTADYRLDCRHDDGHQTLSYYASDVVSTTSPVDKAVLAEETLDHPAFDAMVMQTIIGNVLMAITATYDNDLDRLRATHTVRAFFDGNEQTMARQARRSGSTLSEIGDAMGVSRQRAHQLVKGS